MKKIKYSLKKVYESVLKNRKTDIVKELRDSQVRNVSRNILNSKTLEDLYYKPANDDNVTNQDVINQTISTEIPGLGTFDLTPVQIGLLGCIDQYYYGDKQLALNLINVLKTGQSIELEQTNQRVRLAAGRIRENENNDSSSKFYNLERVKKFLNHCVQLKVLDEKLRIITNKSIHFDKEYNISSGLGYLFEYFVCLNLHYNNYKTNINDMLQNKIRLSVIYVIVILKIINNKNIDVNNLNSYNIFDAKKDDIEELYNTLNVSGNTDFFYNQIHPEVEKEKLNFIFNIKQEALDVIIKYDQIVTCYLDVKTSAKETKTSKGEYYCRPDISSKKDAVNKFNTITRANNKVSENCNIGMLNFNYVIKNNKIQIRQIKSIFNGFNHIHNKIMNKKIKEYQIPYEDRLTSGKTYVIDNQKQQFYFINLPSYSIDSDKAAKAVKKEMKNNFKELVIEKLIDIKDGKSNETLTNLLRGKTFKEYDFTRNNTDILAEIVKDIINDSNINLSNIEDLITIYKEMFIINNKFLENNIAQPTNSWGEPYSKERLAYKYFTNIVSSSPIGNFKKTYEVKNSLANQIYKIKSDYSVNLSNESFIDAFTYTKNSLDNFIELLNHYNIPADYIITRINNTNSYLQNVIETSKEEVKKNETIVGIDNLSKDEKTFLKSVLKNIEKYSSKKIDKNKFNENQSNLLNLFNKKDSEVRKKIKSNLNSLQKIKTCLEGIKDFNGLQNDKENIEKKDFAINYSIKKISDTITILNSPDFNVDVLRSNEDNREYNIIKSFLEREKKGLNLSNKYIAIRAIDNFWKKIKKQSKDDPGIISTAIGKYKNINPINTSVREQLIAYVEKKLG